MVGFVQPLPRILGNVSSLAQHKVQCFHAKQVKHYDIEKTKAFNTGKVKYNKIIEHKSIKPEPLISAAEIKKQVSQPKTKKTRHNMHLEHKPSDEMDLLISAVNSADLGWKADTCKY